MSPALFLLATLMAETPAAAKPAGPIKVKLETSKGSIVLELDAAKAPKTVENFVQYVRDGYYDGTVFHRVIDGFMVQGGGFTEAEGKLSQKSTRPSIPNEADNGLRNARGTIAMARTDEPHSASAQFFINHRDNVGLNHTSKSIQGWGYAVFGKVISGMDVVDAIAASKTTSKPQNGIPRPDVPVDPVLIIKATIEP